MPNAVIESSFSPQWNDYDIMKNRWKYIKPQTKRFVYENKLLLPTSNFGSTVRVQVQEGRSKTQIQGKYIDAANFREIKRNQNI